MSGFVSKNSFLSLLRGFNRAGRGGPARLLTIAGVGVSMAALAIGASSITHPPAPESSVAKMPEVDALPGGMQSNAAQDALLLRHAQDKARQALANGESYTPPMPASVPLKIVDTPAAVETAKEEPPPQPVVRPVPEPAPTYVPPEESHDEPARFEKIASTSETTGAAEDAQYKQAAGDLFRQWEARPPRTDLVLTPAADVVGDVPPGARYEDGAERAPRGYPQSRQARPAPEMVLVPAGRGVYAHTIVSVNSDTGGPIVLEADSGPLAGDRMIGMFSKNQMNSSLFGNTDRLIVQVHTIEHHGQAIQVRGLVIAPDSMETAVATSVDQHYFERFALPAAAAFVAGLGQAIALSGSTMQFLPYGGYATSYRNLDFRQQAGIAAGAAGAQVGQTLQMQTPKTSTVYLAANAGVGVVFLQNVVAPTSAETFSPAGLNTK